jgi:pimeloyl-ACP methyl ester carboxylesterase
MASRPFRRHVGGLVLLAISMAVLCPQATLGQKVTAGQNLMLPSVLSPAAEKDDWKVLRGRIHDKILASWGKCPVAFAPATNAYKEISRYEKHGLTHIVYNYQVFDDSWQRGILVLPANYQVGKKYPLVLAIHGTNGEQGADGMLDPDKVPHRAYAIELARKGYVVFCPDHFGFGDDLKTKSQEAVYTEFEAKYPEWTITGRQMLGFIRAIDLVFQLPTVDADKGVGVIGNSLGGRTALYLAAFDQRVSAAVVSTGISPMISNTYRGLNTMRREQPLYWQEVEKHGRYLWDYNELIALCAPRALLVVEPLNDPHNPSVHFSVQAVLSAMPVWQLLGKPEQLNFLMHGDGHDTTDPVRELAYKWFDRFLMKKQ